MRALNMVTRMIGIGLAGIAGIATAQTVDLTTPVETPAPETAEPGTKLSVTVGLGAAFAPDYEGSDNSAFVPLWNLRLGNLYHPETQGYRTWSARL